MKRGQSSVEFLATYGWAFLILTITLGLSIHFNVFSPENLYFERCLVSAGFTCDDFQLQKHRNGVFESEVSIKLTNRQGESIMMQQVQITCPDCVPGYTVGDNRCGIYGFPPPLTSISLKNGDAVDVLCNPNPSYSILFPEAGKKQKVFFEFTYIKPGKPFSHVAKGEIIANVMQE